MAIILVPTALRQYTDNLSEIEVSGNNIKKSLDELSLKYPDLQKHLFTDKGTLRSFVNVYLNEEDIRELNGLETLIEENDTIILVPSIAGGN